MCQGKAFTLLTLMYIMITTPEWMLSTSIEVNSPSSHSVLVLMQWLDFNTQQFYCGHFAFMQFHMGELKHFQRISTGKSLCRKPDLSTATHVMPLYSIFWYWSESCCFVANVKTCDNQFVFTISWFPWLSAVCTVLSSWPRREHSIPRISKTVSEAGRHLWI